MIIMKLIISEEIIMNGYSTHWINGKRLKREDGRIELLPSIIIIG